MTSLLSKLARLFPESVPLEDLFTEAVARLFERRPDLCIAWLKGTGLLPPAAAGMADEGYVRVSSRPDLLIEVHRPSPEDPAEREAVADVVLMESKIGSGEGHEQLRRYAEHLDGMAGFRGKTLLYVTRAYDPKDPGEILAGLAGDVGFKQLRWHDFYHFLQRMADKDALAKEVMDFMEEQGMARTYRLSTADLMALSGLPRAFEIFDETLGGEVRAELESFARRKIRREAHSLWEVRVHLRYQARALLHEHDLLCDAGYQLGKVGDSAHASILRLRADSYPAIFVFLEARPGAVGRETSVAAMKQIALNEDWEPYNLDNPSGWAGVRRVKSLADVLPEEDHVAAVQRFFVESIQKLREELTAFRKEHPELVWKGQ